MASAYWRQVHAVADQMEPELRRLMLEAFRKLERLISVDTLADLIQRRDVAALNRLLSREVVERLLEPANRQLMLGAIETARQEAARLGTIRGSLTQINPNTVAVARASAARLVTRIAEETRAAIRSVIVRAVQGEMTSRQAAQQIKP